MTFEEAKALLSQSVRDELRDHAFGDREIYWTTVGGEDVASGYCGEGITSVTVGETYFIGEQAVELAKLGRTGSIERNDSTGPDEYQDGRVMRGLTSDDIAFELVHGRGSHPDSVKATRLREHWDRVAAAVSPLQEMFSSPLAGEGYNEQFGVLSSPANKTLLHAPSLGYKTIYSLEYLNRKIKLFCDHYRLTGDHAKDRRRINNLSLNTKLTYRHYLKMRETMFKQIENQNNA